MKYHCIITLILATAATVLSADTHLVLHWPMEEGGGTNTLEAVSGDTHIATLLNGPQWTNGLAPGSAAAINFRNTSPDSYLDAGTLDTNDLYGANVAEANGKILGAAWTIASWIVIPTGTDQFGDRCIITSDTTGGQNWWLFFVQDYAGIDNNLGFDFRSVRRFSGLSVPEGRPVFVAIQADSSGTAFSASTKSRFAMWDTTSGWRFVDLNDYVNIRLDGLEIGSFNDGTREFIGSLDEVRIYNRALSEADLNALVAANGIAADLGGAVAVLTNTITTTNIDFRVIFSEDVQLFDATDLNITTTGTLLASPPAVTGAGSVYTASVPISGEGTITVDLIPGSGVQTLDAQPLVYHTPASGVIDFTSPYVTDLFYPTTSQLVRITFSEPVAGFDDAEFDLTVSQITNLSYAEVFSVQAIDSTTYVFQVDAGVPDGVTGGAFRVSANLASDITDLVGNPLTTPNPTNTVYVSADRYQLWAIAKGLTAGSNFNFRLDADADGRSNGNEFLRDEDPLQPNDLRKRAFHIAEVNGTHYAVLTLAAPDDMLYSASPSTQVFGFYGMDSFGLSENITAAHDVRNLVGGSASLMEDPAISTPPGMPALSEGYNYRHFRFTEPISSNRTGFIMIDTDPIDPEI